MSRDELKRWRISSFRPLTGFLLLSFPRRYGGSGEHASRWGRSWLAITSVDMKIYSLRPWRPLHRLRGPPPPLWQGRLEIRSVPLRGYGFEMTSTKFASKRALRRFRPLAGFLLLSFPRRYVVSGEQRDPMGALVACIHF